ncbi:MAG: LamG-like jellyroll fold domain-containing protein, partial [bacterium]
NGWQTVVVDGQDDSDTDGNVSYSILVAADNASSDTNYTDSVKAYVFLKNIDNEVPGLRVSEISGHTSEAGGTAFFTARLTSKPSADVVLGVQSDNTSEGAVSTSSLTFTSSTWNAPQTVTVTGQDDNVRDNATAYTVTLSRTSSGAEYANLDNVSVLVVNDDNEIPGLSVSEISGSTTEAGGTAWFTVVLSSIPSSGSSVVLDVSSSDTSEGTVSSPLTFTTSNWNARQTVTVTGVNDNATDGNQAYAIEVAVNTGSTTDTSGYDNLDNVSVLLSNIDDETAGFLVSDLSGTVSEKQTSALFTVRLTSAPNGDVVVSAVSDNTSEASVSPSSATFTSSTWNTETSFTVTGVDDSLSDGDQPFKISLSVNTGSTADTTGYAILNPPDVVGTNVDDEAPAITVSAASGPTTEDNGTAVFTVVLNTLPTDTVTVGLSLSDSTEATFSSTGTTDISETLTFTTSNWNSVRTTTVYGVDDNVKDGDQAYAITVSVSSSNDTDYAALDNQTVLLRNVDDETPGFLVSAADTDTSEAGDNATFSVRLTSAPVSGLVVVLDMSSSDEEEGRVNNTTGTSTLTFSSGNWSTAASVTVYGQDDSSSEQDGDVRYRVNLSVNTGSTTASEYSLLDPPDVSLVNKDNDRAGFQVSGPSAVSMSENGGSLTFTVALNTVPTGSVTVPIYISDNSEAQLTGSVDNLTLTFSTTTAQTVTVTGQDDNLSDGDQQVRAMLGMSSSTDANYNGLNPEDVSFLVTDDESGTPGVIVTPPDNASTTESGTNRTFTVALASKPTADVNIPIYVSDSSEALLTGSVDNLTLTFSSGNWNTAQTVTALGQDDNLSDCDVSYSVLLMPATSSDARYHGLNAQDLSFVNLDNETQQCYSSTTVPDYSGLFAYYAFDGNANADNSTFDGTINGNVVAANDSQRGSVLSFSGDSGSYVSMPNGVGTPDIIKFLDTEYFSFSLWLYPERVDDFNGILSKYQTFSQASFAMAFKNSKIEFSDNDNGTTLRSNQNISTSAWTHVFLTHDPSGGKRTRIYINGFLDNYADGLSWNHVDTFMSIGCDYCTSGASETDIGGNYRRFFKGKIDDVRLYEATVSAQEVYEIYTQESS